MRLFVATMLPQADEAFYSALVHGVAAAVRGGVLRAVPRHTAHITHAFLGDVAPENLARVSDALSGVLQAASPLDVVLGAPGLLAASRTPRLILVPVIEGRQALFDLQVAMTLALRAVAGLSALPMPKPPHVTIARFARTATRRDAERASGILARSTGVLRPVRVGSVELMQSTLGPAGPRYDQVFRFDLDRRP